MFIPSELYDILIYNHDLTLLTNLRRWSSLSFSQRLNAPWNHQITMEYGYDDPDLETVRNIADDSIVVIYRTDPITGLKTKVYEGFHQTLTDQVRSNGGIIINMYGVGYTQLLQRRIVLPTSGQEYNTRSGKAETVIKGFVNDCMLGVSDLARTMPGMSIAVDMAEGNNIIYAARYTNLLSVCETVAEQGNLDFGIYGGESLGTFVFDARSTWGLDCRIGNTADNIPVLFSIENDNMLIPILSINASAEQNFAYVGGDGQGTARVIREVYDAAANARTPWSRKEVFVEARQQADNTALDAVGNLEIENRKVVEKLSFTVKQTDSSRWMQDWGLGYLISARYYTHVFDKQITGIDVSVSPSNQSFENITLDMEDLRNQ